MCWRLEFDGIVSHITHIHTHAYTRIHTHTHTYTHIPTHMRRFLLQHMDMWLLHAMDPGSKLMRTPHREKFARAVLEHVEPRARVIVGPRGMGKTTMLKQTVRAMDILASPAVLPVYVSCEMRGMSIAEQVCRHLEGKGIVASKWVNDTAAAGKCHDLLMWTLATTNKRLMLVADEVEELYCVQDPAHVPASVSGIQTLHALSGSSLVQGLILCSSSLMLPSLLFQQEDPAVMKATHPVVMHVQTPELNPTRFLTTWTGGGLPVDVDAVEKFLHKHSSDHHRRQGRLMCALAGGKISFEVPETPAARKSLMPFHASLLRVAMHEFVHMNADVYKSLRGFDGKMSPVLTMSVDWEHSIRPVKWEVLSRLWRAAFPTHSPSELTWILYLLEKHGWIAVDGEGDECSMHFTPRDIYPATILDPWIWHGL